MTSLPFPPIKIAHVTTVDMSLRYLLLNQLGSLRQAGYDVVGVSASGENVPAIESAGIRHIAVPMTRRLTPLADLVSLWRLYRVMRRERFTIVHTHTPKPGLLGQLAATLAGVPVVVNTIHGFYFHDGMSLLSRRLYVILERFAALCSDVILSQNREDIETALRKNVCRPEKMRFLGNGIDLTLFDRARLVEDELALLRRGLNIPSEALVVGFVGRLVREKGILEFLQAARLVVQKETDVRFLLVGPIDDQKADMLTPGTARQAGVEEMCVFTGLRNDMPEMYALMNVFVLPSHREGFPRSPMEASAMGVPCVVTNIRGCREAVEHGRNGLLVPPGDVQALAGTILELLTDREKALRMGQEGRRMAMERFDERAVHEKVKSEYARLLAEKGLRRPVNPE